MRRILVFIGTLLLFTACTRTWDAPTQITLGDGKIISCDRIRLLGGTATDVICYRALQQITGAGKDGEIHVKWEDITELKLASSASAQK